MYTSKNKTDLIIEVWEKLDCESVGGKEIVAVEKAVKAQFGEQAIDSPMITARLLADEGAELRHSEIMQLYVERATDRPHDAALNNLFDLTDFDRLESSLRNAENLRKKLLKDNDNKGLRLLRQAAIDTKTAAMKNANDKRVSAYERAIQCEAAEWITLWLQSPELFTNWVKLRRSSQEFKTWFGEK